MVECNSINWFDCESDDSNRVERRI